MFRWKTAFIIVLVLSACTFIPPRTPTPSVTATSQPTSTRLPAHTATPKPSPRPSATATLPRKSSPTKTPSQAAVSVPRPDHVVVLMFENHGYPQIVGNECCAYINQQAQASALMIRSFGVTHPSQPNYLALFSGSTQGVTDDTCPPPGSPYSTPNLGQQLIDAGLTFAGYSEDLPASGSTVCSTDNYALKHNPWANFNNVPSSANLPFSSFPTDFTQLPTMSFVVPNLCHDMHDCAPSTGDDWMSSHLDAYIQWAQTHNSLLIVTFDEDDYSQTNLVTTFFEGPMVKPGQYSEHITHYNVLRTLEVMYGLLPHVGQASKVGTITDIWIEPTATAP